MVCVASSYKVAALKSGAKKCSTAAQPEQEWKCERLRQISQLQADLLEMPLPPVEQHHLLVRGQKCTA